MMRRIPSFALGVSTILLTVALCTYLLLTATSRELCHTAREVAEAVQKTLHITPEVRVDERTVLQGSAPVLQMTTMQEQFEHRMHWSSTWMGSTKEILLEGEFTANAGFDLKKALQIDFDSRSHSVGVRLPEPSILSVEINHVQSTQDPGWWNQISDADRTLVLNQFTAEARKQAEHDTSLLRRTYEEMERQLTAILAPSGLNVAFENGGNGITNGRANPH